MQDEPPFTIKKPFPEIMLVERKKKTRHNFTCELKNSVNFTATVWRKFPSELCPRKACSLRWEHLMLETTGMVWLKRSTRFPEPCLLQTYHRTLTVGDLQFTNMEKLSKTMLQQEILKKKKSFKLEVRGRQHLTKSWERCFNWRVRRTQGVHTPSSKSKQRLLGDWKVIEKCTVIAQVTSKNVVRGH